MSATAILEAVNERPARRERRDWPLASGHEPPLGAHLVTPRGLYTHHGVYVGDGQVIHYAGPVRRPPRGLVEQLPLAEFGGGRGVWVRFATLNEFAYGPVIERARSRLGERRYRLLWNNCEHLCDWCLRALERDVRETAWRSLRRNFALALRNFGSSLAFQAKRVWHQAGMGWREARELTAGLLARPHVPTESRPFPDDSGNRGAYAFASI